MSVYPSACGGYSIPGPPGEPGQDGLLLDSWRGPWDPDAFYVPGDLVSYQGSVYILGGEPSVPGLYALADTGQPPDDPWELFVQGSSPHWLGFVSTLPAVASGENTLIPTAEAAPGSDTGWYTSGPSSVTVLNSGLYVLSAALNLFLTDVPDPAVPTLRSFQISASAIPVASQTVWVVGQSWAATMTSPMIRVNEGEEIRFLVRQDSGFAGSVEATLSLAYAGS